METILNQVKVNRGDAFFAWVKTLTFKWNENVLSPSKRNDIFESFVYISVQNLMKEIGNEVGNMDPIGILNRAGNDMPFVIYSYAKIALLKKGIQIDIQMEEDLKRKINNANFKAAFQTWATGLLSGKPNPAGIEEAVRIFSWGEDGNSKFIEDFIHELLPIETNIEDITELKVGSIVCGYSLIKLCSKKEHSEIWEVQKNGRKNALKLEPIDIDEKELKKLVGNRNFEKVVQHIKTTDTEYLNYLKLKDYQYRVGFFNIDYFHPLRMKVKIMSWLDGPIDKITIQDKKAMIYHLYHLTYELHKRGLMYNGFKPSHVMVKPSIPGEVLPDTVKSAFRIVDYKYITEYKGHNLNVNGDHISLSLLSKTQIVTPYDDIESLLFTINDIINNKVNYNDNQDQFHKKNELSSYSNLVADAINAVRTLRQFDIYVNSDQKPVDYQIYIKEIYENGINNNGTIIAGITTIMGNLYSSYNEVSDIEISLVGPDLALLKKIKTNVVSSNDPLFYSLRVDPTKTNEVCLAILNYQINAYTPNLEFQPYIERYFRY